MKIKRLRVSAIWLLPLYFMSDFTSTLIINNREQDTVNHAAHIGGFLWGTFFYFAVCKPLKSKYHVQNAFDYRRAYLMTLSLISYSVLLVL